MGRKIAVAIVHGIGRQSQGFAGKMIEYLDRHCREECGDDLVFRPVYWGEAIQKSEDDLWSRVQQGGNLRYRPLRRLLIDFMGDVIAYQPGRDRREAYEMVHASVAHSLRWLASEAGDDAPLVIVAHSLGTIITSNYFYELQYEPEKLEAIARIERIRHNTPLERGETLSALYTLGSPLALYAIRFNDFGTPINVPDVRLTHHYPALAPLGEWINIYDADDPIGFPLRTLNEDYQRAVTEDREVNIGNPLVHWNPLSHLVYWTNPQVIDMIGTKLAAMWRALNPPTVHDAPTNKHTRPKPAPEVERFRRKLVRAVPLIEPEQSILMPLHHDNEAPHTVPTRRMSRADLPRGDTPPTDGEQG